MKKKYDIQDFINQADENGFVALSVFCNKVFRLNAAVIAAYFNEDDQFYNNERTVKARENIRHNITFEVKPLKRINPNTPEITTYKVHQGGIYKDDLEKFIGQIKVSIEENSQLFDEVYKEYQQKRFEEARKNIADLNQQLKKEAEGSFWRKIFGKKGT